MQTLTRTQLTQTLHTLGLRRGDTVLCHSALQFLGKPENGLDTITEALDHVLGFSTLEGTLALPSFNFDFAQGLPYHPETSPAQKMGALPENFRRRPQVCRTPHPLQSLVVTGRFAQDLCSRDTPSAFDENSAFARLVKLDGWLLLLGADIQAASIIHYSEQRAQVPYRYWKTFTAPYANETRTYRMFVRDLTLDPHLNLAPLQAELIKRRQWYNQPLNYGSVSACRLRDFVQTADDLLAQNPWIFVTNSP